MQNWRKKRVQDLGEVITGRTPSTLNEEYYGGAYNLLSPADLDNGKYASTAHRKLTKAGFEQCRPLPKDTVLVGCIGNVGKLAMVGDDRSATNQQINALICDTDTDPHFAYYSFWSNRDRLKQAAVITTVPMLNKSNFSDFAIDVPPLPEQQRIAQVLSTVQQAIEQQDRLIRTTTELKQALMQKLFTEGLRGEAQKETEIGAVPQSWEVLKVEEVCEKITVGIVVKPASHYVDDGVPTFRSLNVRADRIQREPMKYISQAANDGPLAKSRLAEGDVLIVRTGFPGTSCVVPEEFHGSNCIDLIIARPDLAKVQSHFLSRFFNSDAAKLQVLAGKVGLAQQHYNVGAVKTTLIPVPPLKEQDEFLHALNVIDTKHDNAFKKRDTLQDLFRTLLHELMTGKVRVGANQM